MSSKSSKADKLQALRAVRAGGSRLKQWQPEEADLYDEVSEEQYKSIVGKRLARDDFIEDDDGSGYADNGMDVWEGARNGSENESEEEEEKRSGKKKTGRAAKAKPLPPSKPSAYRPQVTEDSENDFMADLLGTVDNANSHVASSSPLQSGYLRKRKTSPDDTYDSGSMTNPSSDGFELPSSGPLFRGASTDEGQDGRDIGLWEMRTGESAKKPRLHVKAEDSETPRNARKGVSFANDMDLDGGFDFGEDNLVKTEEVEDDDEEDFLVRSDRAITAKANQSKAKDRLMAAIGANKTNETTPKATPAKSRRALVNGSAMSTKLETEKQARIKAEVLAAETKAEAVAEAKSKGNAAKGAAERQSWLRLQETLNTGSLGDDGILGTPFTATAASQKKYVPTMRIDAFEPLDSEEASGMDTESDGEHSDSSIKARQDRRNNRKTAAKDAPEVERNLKFYWLDYLEQDGIVHLLGKVFDRSQEKYVSCCVTITGIQRNLFILPRERRLDEEFETDQEVSVMDVHREFDALRRKHGVEGGFGMKKVTRKYAFEQPNVPRGEADWYKVVYGYDQPQLPGDLSGATFSKVFGTNTSAFEMLVIKRKIMGPCWLEVKGCLPVTQKPTSWCHLEVRIKDPKNVKPFSESDSSAPKEIPPLTVMSINARTIVNHTMNTQELLAVSTAVWEQYNIDDPTPVEKLRHVPQTVMRPLGEKFPPNFEARAPRQQIKTVRSEREVLNLTLIQIQRADPDVIVGHDFLGTTLEVLLTRMKELKADHWSRIGRIRRTQLRVGVRAFGNAKYLAGRLVADLSSDGAKGMIDSVTWSLTEMCSTQLGFMREDIDPEDTAGYFDGYAVSPDRLLHFIRHLQMDAFAQMAITAKVQLLPLTKQLTNLAGNSWNRTMTGARAERNEYILLHEFHRLKYVCPDKGEGKPSSRAAKKPTFDAEGNVTVEPKKNKYQGGLVFEPKRGLWDTYVMVMDFNSLYPSIIQEYNIDFTTVERDPDADEDEIPDVPSPDVPQGVLPRLIATLVGRRKQVKSLMKDSSTSQIKMMQYDIKQKALKLTANSMYGCLGFAGSRFYARPLAALTTFKGRETLTQTKEVAEGTGLDVVYGDTDSVFVNSNVTTYPEAVKIANEFKRNVNDRYKLLEIDLDAVFSRVLLLQKKKYAAVKVSENGTAKTEIKGLDMVRREYCKLSKTVSGRVLEEILSGKATEDAITEIHGYLTAIGNDLRDGKIDLDDLIVFKRLSKNPEDYTDKKSQPHVQVALRMKQRSGVGKAGEVIPYVFCLGADGKTSKSAQADHAFHPDEFRRKDSDLKIDFDFYLSQQVLPPIERLCEEIEGTDRSRLAECLGLDPARYQKTVVVSTHDKEFFAFQSQISDKERFRECERLLLHCRGCRADLPMCSITEDLELVSVIHNEGVKCPNCAKVQSAAGMAIQVEAHIREHINKYYENTIVCSDCEVRTRMMSVYGRRCVSTAMCRGEMRPLYSDSQLYNQLLYLASIFDTEKALEVSRGTPRAEEISSLVAHNQETFSEIKAMIDAYLNKNGRRYVSMDSLFGFMNRMAL